MKLKFPDHTQSFFSTLFLVTNFDIIPSQVLNSYIFKMNSTNSFNDRFTLMGFDSINFIDNVGSFVYYLMIIASLLVIMLIS